jgi:hypothetical protein
MELRRCRRRFTARDLPSWRSVLEAVGVVAFPIVLLECTAYGECESSNQAVATLHFSIGRS